MPPARKADVIVAVDRLTPSTVRCLRQILEISDPALNRLIVVTGPCPDPALEDLSRCVRRWSASCDRSDHSLDSRGLEPRARRARRRRRPACRRHDGLRRVAHRACGRGPFRRARGVRLAALEHGARHRHILKTDDVPARSRRCRRSPGRPSPAFLDPQRPRRCRAPASTCAGRSSMRSVRWTPVFSTLQSAIEDWIMRAQAIGYFGKRANHAYVQHSPPRAGADDHGFLLVRDRAILEKRHPHRAHQVTNFRQTWTDAWPSMPSISYEPASCASPMISEAFLPNTRASVHTRSIWRERLPDPRDRPQPPGQRAGRGRVARRRGDHTAKIGATTSRSFTSRRRFSSGRSWRFRTVHLLT